MSDTFANEPPKHRLARHSRDEERQRKIADFALTGLNVAIQGAMGQAIPSSEDARELVRLGRVVFSELDQPTERPEPDDEETTHDPQPLSWDENLYQ